jgi:hypothetical protein
LTTAAQLRQSIAACTYLLHPNFTVDSVTHIHKDSGDQLVIVILPYLVLFS